jgi:hypothetical protein
VMVDGVVAEGAGPLVRFLRWCGLALVAGGVLMVVATLLHPARETAATIVASEWRLVAADVVHTLAWLLVLLGLPGVYAAQRSGMGRLGLVGFLMGHENVPLWQLTTRNFLGAKLLKWHINVPHTDDATMNSYTHSVGSTSGGSTKRDRYHPELCGCRLAAG